MQYKRTSEFTEMSRRSFLKYLLDLFVSYTSLMGLFLKTEYDRETEKIKNKTKEVCDFLKGEDKDIKLRIYGRKFDYNEFSRFILSILENRYKDIKIDEEMVQKIMKCYASFLWIDVNYEGSFNINPLIESLNLSLGFSKNMSYGSAQIQPGRAKEAVEMFEKEITRAINHINNQSGQEVWLDLENLAILKSKKQIVQALDLQGDGSVFCGLLAFAASFLKYLEKIKKFEDDESRKSTVDEFNLFALSVAEYVGGPSSAGRWYKQNVNADSNSEAKVDLGKRFLALRYVTTKLCQSENIPANIKNGLKEMYKRYIQVRDLEIVKVLSGADEMIKKFDLKGEDGKRFVEKLMGNIRVWTEEGIKMEEKLQALVPTIYKKGGWGVVDSKNIILKIVLAWRECKKSV